MNFYLIFLTLVNIKYIFSYINLSDINCGISSSHRLGRIVGGSDAIPGQFPWMVSITRHGGHFCGGSIVNNRWIVTAAHCLCSGTGDVLLPQQLKITLAQHNLKQKNDGISYEMDIKHIIIHPDYTCTKVAHDIAMLQLNSRIKWSERVQPVCLANNENDPQHSTYEGVEATVAGWGWLNENTTVGRSDVLQKVNVEVFNNRKCNDWFRLRGKKTQIRDSQMCAGFENGGKDSCWADSGGPLMIRSKGYNMLIGVVSTGIGCARPQLPGLYTRISEYVPWVEKIVKSI